MHVVAVTTVVTILTITFAFAGEEDGGRRGDLVRQDPHPTLDGDVAWARTRRSGRFTPPLLMRKKKRGHAEVRRCRCLLKQNTVNLWVETITQSWAGQCGSKMEGGGEHSRCKQGRTGVLPCGPSSCFKDKDELVISYPAPSTRHTSMRRTEWGWLIFFSKNMQFSTTPIDKQN